MRNKTVLLILVISLLLLIHVKGGGRNDRSSTPKIVGDERSEVLRLQPIRRSNRLREIEWNKECDEKTRKRRWAQRTPDRDDEHELNTTNKLGRRCSDRFPEYEKNMALDRITRKIRWNERTMEKEMQKKQKLTASNRLRRSRQNVNKFNPPREREQGDQPKRVHRKKGYQEKLSRNQIEIKLLGEVYAPFPEPITRLQKKECIMKNLQSIRNGWLVCAVCDRRLAAHRLKLFNHADQDDDDQSLWENLFAQCNPSTWDDTYEVKGDIPKELIEFYDISRQMGDDIFKNVLLSTRGINGNSLQICDDCEIDLRKKNGKVPLYAIANCNWIGECSLLKELTLAERLVSGLHVPNIHVHVVTKTGNRVFTHSLIFDGGVESGAATILPQLAENIQRFNVIFRYAKNEPFDVNSLNKVLKTWECRVDKLREAYDWLIAHNIFYKDVQFDEEAAEKNNRYFKCYDREGNCFLIVEQGDVKEYKTEHSFTPEGDVDITHDVYLPCERIHNDDTCVVKMELENMQQYKKSKDIKYVMFRKGNRLVWLRNPGSMEKSCFHMFPYGTGGPRIPRNRKMKLEQYYQMLTSLSIGNFEKDITFNTLAFEDLRWDAGFSHLSFKLRRASSEQLDAITSVTETELEEALKATLHERSANLEQRPVSKHAKTTLRYAEDSLAASFGNTYDRYAARRLLDGMSIRLGHSQFFVTLNPSDRDSLITYCCTTGEDLSKVQSIPLRSILTKEQTENLFAQSFTFEQTVDLFINNVLRFDKINKKSFEGGGLLGICKGYFVAIETTARGTLHAHILVWIEGLPLGALDFQRQMNAITEEVYMSKLRSYLDSVIMNSLPYEYNAQLECTQCKQGTLDYVPLTERFHYRRKPYQKPPITAICTGCGYETTSQDYVKKKALNVLVEDNTVFPDNCTTDEQRQEHIREQLLKTIFFNELEDELIRDDIFSEVQHLLVSEELLSSDCQNEKEMLDKLNVITTNGKFEETRKQLLQITKKILIQAEVLHQNSSDEEVLHLVHRYVQMNTNDALVTEEAKLVFACLKYQMHKVEHLDSCMEKGKLCRYRYPMEPRNETGFDVDLSIRLKKARFSEHFNGCLEVVLCSFFCNSDCKPLLSASYIGARQRCYVVKYLTKEQNLLAFEHITLVAKQFIAKKEKLVQEEIAGINKTPRSQASSVILTIMSAILQTQQLDLTLINYLIRNRSCFHCSHEEYIIHMNYVMAGWQKRVLTEVSVSFAQKDPDTGHRIFAVNDQYQLYIHRPKAMENLSLYEFFTFYYLRIKPSNYKPNIDRELLKGHPRSETHCLAEYKQEKVVTLHDDNLPSQYALEANVYKILGINNPLNPGNSTFPKNEEIKGEEKEENDNQSIYEAEDIDEEEEGLGKDNQNFVLKSKQLKQRREKFASFICSIFLPHRDHEAGKSSWKTFLELGRTIPRRLEPYIISLLESQNNPIHKERDLEEIKKLNEAAAADLQAHKEDDNVKNWNGVTEEDHHEKEEWALQEEGEYLRNRLKTLTGEVLEERVKYGSGYDVDYSWIPTLSIKRMKENNPDNLKEMYKEVWKKCLRDQDRQPQVMPSNNNLVPDRFNEFIIQDSACINNEPKSNDKNLENAWSNNPHISMTACSKLFNLNQLQDVAFRIIASSLIRKTGITTECDGYVDMGDNSIIFGEGGSGKSYVIKCVRYFAKAWKIYDKILLTSEHGAHAALIGGNTIMSTCGVSVGKSHSYLKPNDHESQERFKNYYSIVIDELSTTKKKSIFQLANTIASSKQLDMLESNTTRSNKIFDHLGVNFFGDPLQLGVVKGTSIYLKIDIQAKREAINKNNANKNKATADEKSKTKTETDEKREMEKIKALVLENEVAEYYRSIYNVIELTENQRFKDDPTLQRLSQAFRDCSWTQEDVDLLNSRVLTADMRKQFTQTPVCLFSTRAEVLAQRRIRIQKLINSQTANKLVSWNIGKELKSLDPTLNEEELGFIFDALETPTKTNEDIKVPPRSFHYIGEHVIVRDNYAVNFGLATSASGTIKQFIFSNSAKLMTDAHGVQHYSEPPLEIILEMEEKVGPDIEEYGSQRRLGRTHQTPLRCNYLLKGELITKKISYWGIAMTSSSEMTCHGIQGKTIRNGRPIILSDFKKHFKTFEACGFYVALTRGEKFEQIFLENPVTLEFLQSLIPPASIYDEMERLSRLTYETIERFNKETNGNIPLPQIYQRPVNAKRKTHLDNIKTEQAKKKEKKQSKEDTNNSSDETKNILLPFCNSNHHHHDEKDDEEEEKKKKAAAHKKQVEENQQREENERTKIKLHRSELTKIQNKLNEGLPNLFNTCYINAALQALRHVINLQAMPTSTDDIWNCIAKIDTEARTTPSNKTLTNKHLNNFCNFLFKQPSKFQRGAQEDVGELITYLFTKNLDVAAQFQYKTIKTFHCQYCGNLSRFQSYEMGSRCVPPSPDKKNFPNLQQFLDSPFTSQTERIQCQQCNKTNFNVDVVESCINIVGDIVYVQLGRFQYNQLHKITAPVEIPELIQVLGKKYELKASILHVGLNQHNGHYTCEVKEDGYWYNMNDDTVSTIDGPTQGQSPYLLFYVN